MHRFLLSKFHLNFLFRKAFLVCFLLSYPTFAEKNRNTPTGNCAMVPHHKIHVFFASQCTTTQRQMHISVLLFLAIYFPQMHYLCFLKQFSSILHIKLLMFYFSSRNTIQLYYRHNLHPQMPNCPRLKNHITFPCTL